MILDYTGEFYTLAVPAARLRALKKPLMYEHGLDFSISASSRADGVFFTQDPFAAVSFWESATPRAKENLARLRAKIELSWAKDSSIHYDCPADQELWAFQRASLEYALGVQNALIGDMPGLGKTETAICLANTIQAQRTLVICPANIRLQWAERINEWSTIPWQSRIICPILQGKYGVHPKATHTIVSYDLARTPVINKLLAATEWDLLILDEPHYLKEVTSKRTQAIFGGSKKYDYTPIAQKAAKIAALTGTPLPNRPREAFTLCKGLDWESIDYSGEEKFRLRFNPSRTGTTDEGVRWTDERVGRHYELQNRMRGSFMCRHEKHGPNGVMHQLKMPVYDLIRVEETGTVKAALEAERFLDLDVDTIDLSDIKVMGHVAEVRRLMGIAMVPQVADYLEMLYESGEEKLVIFAWHIEVLDILQRRLEKHGCIRIDGKTSAQNKTRLVKQFVGDTDIHFAIGNILSMGTGTDGFQHVCNHGLIAEPDWVPGNNIQCFDRLDRGGQRAQVQGDIFVAPGSIAEKILGKALRKGRSIHKILDDRTGGVYAA